jgi:Clr5 domain
MSSHSGSRGGGRPCVDFNQYKDILYNLYLIDYQSLDDVRRYMQSQYNFNAGYIYIY